MLLMLWFVVVAGCCDSIALALLAPPVGYATRLSSFLLMTYLFAVSGLLVQLAIWNIEYVSQPRPDSDVCVLFGVLLEFTSFLRPYHVPPGTPSSRSRQTSSKLTTTRPGSR